MSILVTGASGFIGRLLTSELAFNGHVVYALVRKIVSGFPKGVHQIVLDFNDSGWVKRLPEKTDFLVHLAQSREYGKFPSGARDMFRINVESTFELLEWARKNHVKRFIFASTGTVYAQSKNKLKESAQSAPNSMYAASKLGAENLIHPYGSLFEVVITRLFSVYGPRQKHMLIPEMIERVRSSREIILARGAGIYLTPLFVEDCVKVFKHLTRVPLDKAINTFNVAGDEVLSLHDIVTKIGKKLRKEPFFKIIDEQPKYLCGDNSVLKSCFSDEFTNFDVGLESII
jgi:UDP-glucose 4-epimerase